MAGNHSHGSPLPKRAAYVVSALTLLFFGLGVHGHLAIGNTRADAVYKSLQMMHLHYHPHPDAHDEEDAAAHPLEHTPITLEIARFGAGLLSLAIVPGFVALLFQDRLFRWWARARWSNHVVVYGHSSRALSLVRDLRAGRHNVFLIGHTPGHGADLPRGVCYIDASAPSRESLAGAALKNAGRFVALSDHDRDNLELLIAAEAEAKSRDTTRPPLECHAHFGDRYLQLGLHQLGAAREGTPTRRQLFNYYDVAARLLAHQYPMPATLAATAPAPEHIVIVGFGAFGQSVALKLVKMGQQLYQQGDQWRIVKPRITAIDPRGAEAAALFLRTHPQFAAHCDFSVVAMSCGDAAFLDLTFLTPSGSRASIVFCLDDEALTLRTLVLLAETCSASDRGIRQIYLRLAKPAALTSWVDALRASTKPGIVLFAPDEQLFSADVLLNQSLDVLARRIHDSYRAAVHQPSSTNVPTALGKTWDELGEEDRESNREAADHLWAKLATLGYQLAVAPAGEAPAPVDAALVRELETRIEELARVEHYRWLTWRALSGWTYGAVRDQTLKHHPDMVEYERLSDEAKEKDRVVVRAIPALLTEGRLHAERQ